MKYFEAIIAMERVSSHLEQESLRRKLKICFIDHDPIEMAGLPDCAALLDLADLQQSLAARIAIEENLHNYDWASISYIPFSPTLQLDPAYIEHKGSNFKVDQPRSLAKYKGEIMI